MSADGGFGASAAPDVVAEVLADYGPAARRVVQHYLNPAQPARFLDELMADYPARGGKLMRPCICIANARLFGGRMDDALQSAAAVEILHNALLIHDDIQDGSEIRRGRPTLHALHGVPLAINAGDAMLLTALRPLLDNLRHTSHEVGLKVLDATQRMARETAEGQALELGWRDSRQTEISDADYLTMVLKKTAWMGMIWPAQIGLLIGSEGRADPDRVVRFGFFLGAAFQIEDDLRNLRADEAYGKEQNGDLLEAKRTLMLLHVRRSCAAAERRRLDAFLRLDRGARTGSDVDWLLGLMERYGSIAYARMVAEGLAGAALHEFRLAYGDLPETRDKAFLASLVPWVFDRP